MRMSEEEEGEDEEEWEPCNVQRNIRCPLFVGITEDEKKITFRALWV